MNDMTIVIPSSGRATQQITLWQLPAHIQRRARLAVPADQGMDYARGNPGQPLYMVPLSAKGISGTRRWIMDACKTRYVMMLDDDMVFAHRPSMESPKLLSLTPGDPLITAMLERWRSLLGAYAHVGLSARQGNNRVNEAVRTCCRMFNAYAYDLERVRTAGVVAGRLPVMEDFDLTLQLLRKGLPNAMIYEWCWNQKGSNADGGCSAYRTPAMQAQAAHKLAELHPGLVRVVNKQSKNWKGMDQRIDVVVSWRKALEESGVTV